MERYAFVPCQIGERWNVRRADHEGVYYLEGLDWTELQVQRIAAAMSQAYRIGQTDRSYEIRKLIGA